MRALHAYARSDPSRLVVEDAPLPELGPSDVLVRVHASGVSPGELDWPTAWLHHDDTPRRPPIVPGHEVAGIVDAVGPDAAGLTVGDAVFGYIDVRRDGADAEYTAARADELAPEPVTLSHAQAAAVPLSGLTAWQALVDHGNLAPGQRVLIHGGAGGVGTFAVQLASWRGAHVVATSASRDADLVRDLGARDVIDYRTGRFEEVVSEMDLVIDTVGGETWERSWRVLRPGGRLVSIAVPRPPGRDPVEGRQAIWFVVRPDREQLMELGRLIDAGHLRPIISDVVPLARGAEVYGRAGPRGGPGRVALLVAAAGAGASAPAAARTTAVP
ncbi:NADP-dependent oxidoreductase [Agromyces sp. Marseille-P2726]|uniref:NADP-dependent oxidoreductase n=1 Tax=Agromyces sp. Marseille-P2726 TaxID=2709132 RepID=UPI00156F301D|nr:NADP-dependent oxidoreductase [Agromyces sp. Marseille-P2726]